MSTTPSAIQAFAAAEASTLASLATALTALATGVTALDTLITNFQNSPGTLSPADQTALDGIQATSKALVAQATAISTTPPGTPVPPPPPLPVTPAA